MKPRVLEVITVRPGFDGITMYVMRLVRNMDPDRVQVDFVFIGELPDELRTELESMGCGVYVIPGRLRHPLRYLRAMRGVIRRGGYGAVHAHGNSCTLAIELMAAKLGGAKVRAAHSHNTGCKFVLAHRLLRPAFNALYTHAWACGAEAGRWLFGNNDFRVLRVSSETAKYAFSAAARDEYRRALGIEDRFVIGCVANFSTQKNHRFLIDVFGAVCRQREDAALVLVGDGALRGDIEARIRETGIEDKVILAGARSDVPGILCACDIMALTSFHEGFPSVLVEWQCSGLRALVSDSVTRDTDLTGLLSFLPTDDRALWVKALTEAQPAGNREEVSAAAVADICAKGYDIAVNARELEEFYLNTLG